MSYVDWNSQKHEIENIKKSDQTAEEILRFVIKKISLKLKPFSTERRFDLHLRLYYGWHVGFEPTPARRELSKLEEEDIFAMSGYPWISVRAKEFGDISQSALPTRLAARGIHYPATLRNRSDGADRMEEKMVDTALVSDLITEAVSTENKSWMLVLGEDIDLMPGVYTAERFIQGTDRRVSFLRSSQDRYLKCKDLLEIRNQ